MSPKQRYPDRCACLKDSAGRNLLLEQFPSARKRSEKTNHFIEWMGEKGADDELAFTTVMKWIMEDVLQI